MWSKLFQRANISFKKPVILVMDCKKLNNEHLRLFEMIPHGSQW